MVKIRIQPGFWLMLTLMILVLPLPWICALLLSSAIHELSHLAALRLSGVTVHSILLLPGGAYMETDEMTPFQGIVSAVAGPMVPLSLLVFARWMPRTALCALIQGCYHLLPVRPLDGGRALESLISYMGWDRRICAAAELFCLPFLVYAAMKLVLLDLGAIPPILCSFVIFRIIYEKFLANRSGSEYNKCTKP